MGEAESDLAAMVRAEVERQANPYQIMVVDSVQESGTVNLQWGDAIINDVAANQAYNPRAEGDVVLVLNHAAGWRVIDKIGAPVEPELPETVEVSFGDGLPAGDFVQVNSIFMKDGAIYGLIGEGPAPGPGDSPRTSTPKPVTITPTARQGYRSGRKDSQRFAQGASPDYPKPWAGLWTYGNKIAEACEGKTVAKMEIRVARVSAYHGTSKKVRTKFGLHNETSPPGATPTLADRFDGPGLGFGSAAWATIPDWQAQRLASGLRKGIGVGAGVSNSTYLIFKNASGNVRITFS
ncbi:minor structural protein [Brevibacterium phage AGM14]|uniref:Minor structural protein n=1 Tax=Brevibacterium phage AGM14 TaxID=2591416 RepID=A0A7D0KK30_9CAUD|nr:minor structural protein [Brevibacterium phage AGM14]